MKISLNWLADFIPVEVTPFPKGHGAIATTWSDPASAFALHRRFGEQRRGPVRFHLDLPCKTQDGYFRFLCPLCGEFNTAVNPKTNLGRCFCCKTNLNPVDLVMIVKHYSFLQAVAFLERLL